ncbi:MAG: hypothetical protein LBG89_00440 [Rickettsiales bacterium]|jgi:hypothetical protein|nr:hypothetical protein [Rickettsiales bacterium]
MKNTKSLDDTIFNPVQVRIFADLLMVPRSVIEFGLDQRTLAHVPSDEKRDVWNRRFFAALWILKSMQSQCEFETREEAVRAVPKRYKDLKSFALDLQQVNPMLAKTTIVSKCDPANKFHDPEIRDAIIPVLAEKYDKTASRNIRYNRSNERLVAAMRKLPAGVRYPSLMAMWNAILKSEPEINATYELLERRVQSDDEIFREYARHIEEGYSIQENGSVRRREANQAIVAEALDDLAASGLRFEGLAEIYMSLPWEVQWRVSFWTFWTYVNGGGYAGIPEKAQGILSKPATFSEHYCKKMVPVVKKFLSERQGQKIFA